MKDYQLDRAKWIRLSACEKDPVNDDIYFNGKWQPWADASEEYDYIEHQRELADEMRSDR